MAKAWVCFGYVDSQIVIRAAYNIANVTRTATGRYRVTFAGAMPDHHYCWTALARSSSNNSTQRLAIVRATSDQKTLSTSISAVRRPRHRSPIPPKST